MSTPGLVVELTSVHVPNSGSMIGRFVMELGLTSDLVILNPKGLVLVVQRKYPPFEGQWALPGGFLEEGETFVDAAVRELKEETSLSVSPWELQRIGIYDEPSRDPRGRTITVAFKYFVNYDFDSLTAGDDAAELGVWPFTKKGLAFDHDKIVRDATNGY